jgi:hypothetical protein
MTEPEPARAEGEVNDTDARLWHPWLRINRVLRDATHALERGGVVSGPGRVQAGARAAKRDPPRGVVQLTGGGSELTASGPICPLELPRDIASVVKMILVESGRPVAPVEPELDRHLVARQWFATDNAGPSAPWRTEHAVRTSRWQLPTSDRFSGLLSEDRLVGHDNLSGVASPRFAPRSAPDSIRPGRLRARLP